MAGIAVYLKHKIQIEKLATSKSLNMAKRLINDEGFKTSTLLSGHRVDSELLYHFQVLQTL